MVPPTERWLTVKSTSASTVQQNPTLLNRRWRGWGSRILSSWRRITGPFIRLTCCSKRVRSSIRLLCGLGALKYCIILNFTREPRSKQIPKIVSTTSKADTALVGSIIMTGNPHNIFWPSRSCTWHCHSYSKSIYVASLRLTEISRLGQNFKFGALNEDIMTVCIEYKW